LPPAGSAGGLVLNLLAGAVIAPVGEEILFRGVATTAWVRSLGPRAGILRGALLFAVVHILLINADSFNDGLRMAAVGFLGRLPVALVLGWVFVRRGSLWAPIGLHAAFNAILLVAAESAARAGA
jgi:membrane protease YdiL (CAAX protease family)